MSDKPKRIQINMETQAEFSARATCINPTCESPLPMGLTNTLCTKCQDQQNVHNQQEIDQWRKSQSIPDAVINRPKGAISIDNYLDNLIEQRDATINSGAKVTVGVVSDKPLKDLISADSGDSIVTNT